MRDSYHLPSITARAICLEIGFIVLCLLFFSRGLQDWSPNTKIAGIEYPYLVSGAELSSVVFRKTGAIPLWNPLVGAGEPVFESLFSFALNPLMFLPMLLFGGIQGGKLSVVIHLLVMGLGGWALARVLRLHWPGRILLALLLAGSGSWLVQIRAGYFQIGVAQTYVPWVLAGLIGTLYLPKRWPIGLLAVASMLLIFAGTFWWVLPTMITAVVITLFSIISRDPDQRLRIDWAVLRRLAIATAFTLGLSAARLLPQVNSGYVYHDVGTLLNFHDFLEVFQLYFLPIDLATNTFDFWIYYHYLLPLAFALFIVAAKIVTVIMRRGAAHWQLVIPALVCILIFTAWAQEKTPFLVWLFQRIPLLAQWRSIGRIAGAASPWIAILAALWFDEFIGPDGPVSRFSPRLRRVAVLCICAGGLVAAFDVLGNLTRYSYLEEINSWYGYNVQAAGFRDLRAQVPNGILRVYTIGMQFPYTLWDTLERQSVGNAGVYTYGVPPTIGGIGVMRIPSEYGVAVRDEYVVRIQLLGYVPVEDAPLVDERVTLWRHPLAPTYAFLVPRSRLKTLDEPITRPETLPISTYTHDIDSIRVSVDAHPPGSVLVLVETNYPGWSVTINGAPARLESVGRDLAVVLPDDINIKSTLNVEFVYRPLLLYWGSSITVLSVIVFAAFLLTRGRTKSSSP